MKELAVILKKHFEQNSPNYGDADSVLDMLYWHYTEYSSPDNEKIVNQFAALRKLVNFSPKEYDQVFYIVSDLCLEHGRLAFQEGIRLGMLLIHGVTDG